MDPDEEKAKRAAHRKMMLERFGPKDNAGNYTRWHYAKQGDVWNAMRELEERIRKLEEAKP